MRIFRIIAVFVFVSTFLTFLNWRSYASNQSLNWDISLISKSSDGTQGNANSLPGGITIDGRYVVFYSDSDNLVADDNNGFGDGFRHDRLTGETIRFTETIDGEEFNNTLASCCYITPNGRYIYFSSRASNIVQGDENNFSDVFLFDTQENMFELISVSTDGLQGNEISGSHISTSDDGRFVVFDSKATNFEANDFNNERDVFLRDRILGTTVRISSTSDGYAGNGKSKFPEISSDGELIAFETLATDFSDKDSNLFFDIYIYQVASGQMNLVSNDFTGSTSDEGHSRLPRLSSKGEVLVFDSAAQLVESDTNVFYDIYYHDLKSSVTSLLSSPANGQGGNGDSVAPTISGDGQFVAFLSYANNLILNDNNGVQDTYWHNTQTGEFILLSKNSSGDLGNDLSGTGYISKGGNYVTFNSKATNLTIDNNGSFYDAFIVELPNVIETPVPTETSTGTSIPTATNTMLPSITPTKTIQPSITPTYTKEASEDLSYKNYLPITIVNK